MDKPTDWDRTAADRPAIGADRLSRLPIATAAERLGLSVDAVRGRLHRGTLRGEKIDGVWFVEMPSVAPTAEPAATTGDQLPPTAEPAAAAAEATAALLAAKDAEILRLNDLLTAEIEARRRADTIILELSRRPIELPTNVDAAVASNQGLGATELPNAGKDGAVPKSSLLGRLFAWMRGDA